MQFFRGFFEVFFSSQKRFSNSSSIGDNKIKHTLVHNLDNTSGNNSYEQRNNENYEFLSEGLTEMSQKNLKQLIIGQLNINSIRSKSQFLIGQVNNNLDIR